MLYHTINKAISTLGLCLTVTLAGVVHADYYVECPKDIPIAYDVDIVVVGGSSGAVACAAEAARQGAQVFLLAPRPYLGTDICSTLRLWLEEDEQPRSKLAIACFGEKPVTTPYRVKAAMDRALLEAGVRVLTGCYATDVLRNQSGHIAGVVMANRSGRQAIKAKLVVDASDRAVVARLAGVSFRPFIPGPKSFKRVVAGGLKRSGKSFSGEKKAFTYDSVAEGSNHRLPVYEYTLQIALPDNSPGAFLRAENQARDLTYSLGSEMGSESLYNLPGDTMLGKAHQAAWPGAEKVSLNAFQPKGVTRLYVLSAYADLSPSAADRLLRPLSFMTVGWRLGRAAAKEASGIPAIQTASLPGVESKAKAASIGENLSGLRSQKLGSIFAGRRPLPILGRYDVVVVGGGTSGAPAGIAAAKSGARTLVLEYLYELGGVGTTGLIGAYWRGRLQGFTSYIDSQVNMQGRKWNAVEKAEWFRQELSSSGAQVWFGTLACGALVEKGKVKGVVVATPWGRGLVLAHVVIDATGNADVAAVAGAPTEYSLSDRGSLNVQVAGFPDRPMKNSYVNTCYTLVDDTDVLDVWHLMTWKRIAPKESRRAFDVGQLIDSRERRRIVGDYVLKTHGILNQRSFPDTISQHYSNFDAAAFPDADLLLLANAKGPDFHTDLPYRCLLPQGLDGILVIGLGASADRDAMTLIRMQPDLQNQGYAAGLVAAEVAKTRGKTRQVDIKAIQKQLVREKILDERVITDRDSYPMSAAQIQAAVEALSVNDKSENLLRPLAAIVAHPQMAIPLLAQRYQETRDASVNLRFAQILGILGDPTGAKDLIEAINATKAWDKGDPLTSQRKTGNLFSDLDRLVIALGCSRAPTALESLITKLKQLKADSKLSHYKAISLALRQFPPCDSAIEPLQKLLKQKGFTGHATVHESAEDRGRETTPLAPVPTRRVVSDGPGGRKGPNLNQAYKELITATLLYRCGDPEGTATAILKQYARDIHGHFARYAQSVLAGRH